MTKPRFDAIVHQFHDEVFESVSCVDCGLCCKNLGPIFRNTDVKHICAYIGMKEKAFHEQFLEQDPDGVGFMLRSLPCPFQSEDNSCEIYEHRTLSCVNFPHTKSINIQRKLVGLALDSLFCPAAFLICEKIIAHFR